MGKGNQQQVKTNKTQNSYLTKGKIIPLIWMASLCGFLGPSLEALAGVPNGTWLSKPQIRFHLSTNTLEPVLIDIKRQNYKIVFLDYRGVSDDEQRRVSQEVREQSLIPVVWVQSPQYRSLTVSQIIYEARHGDAIQVDDHFFANYSKNEFRSLSAQYDKPIFCSIQPFQKSLISPGECNQLDVQCYTPQQFKSCLTLADRLKAVVSLSEKNTLRYKPQLGGRSFNVFLWPHSERFWQRSFQDIFTTFSKVKAKKFNGNYSQDF